MKCLRTGVPVIFLILGLLLSIAGIAAMSAPVTGQESIDSDTVIITIDVDESGEAHWKIEYQTRLNSEDTRTAFESYQADIRQSPDTYTEQLRSRMNSTMRVAQNETGRNMTLENVTVTAETREFPEEYGVVTYTFTWTEFANINNNSMFIGDSISGFYISEGSRLVISAPENFTLESSQPNVDIQRGNRTAEWSGPLSFDDDEPRIQFARINTSTPNTTDPPNNPEKPNNGFLIGGGAVLSILLILATGVAYRRKLGPFTEGDAQEYAEEEDTFESESESESASEPKPPQNDSEEAIELDQELLSKEEQVLAILDVVGGRAKQQTIVNETGWTEAKTSNVLNDMVEDDRIDKFRLGRENVITFPGTEDELGHPHLDNDG